MNISWTAAFFTLAGSYSVYHTNIEDTTLFSVSSRGVTYYGSAQSTKYNYLSRSLTSSNILFEIRDITRDDAGYYNGGVSAYALRAGGGVVLIVTGELYNLSNELIC